MTAIKGYIDNLLDDITGELTERQVHYLTRIISNADRLTWLISDILALSRTDLLQMNLANSGCGRWRRKRWRSSSSWRRTRV